MVNAASRAEGWAAGSRRERTTKAKGSRYDRHECPRINRSTSGGRGEAQDIREVVRGGRGEANTESDRLEVVERQKKRAS
jgi:hypothetical protein